MADARVVDTTEVVAQVEDIEADRVDIVVVVVRVVNVVKEDTHHVHLRVDDLVVDTLVHLAKAVNVAKVVDTVVTVVAHAQVLLANIADDLGGVSPVDIEDIVTVVTLLVEKHNKRGESLFYFLSLVRSSFIFLPNTSTEYSPARATQSSLMASARSGVIHFTASIVS